MASPSNSSGNSWRPGVMRGLPKCKNMVEFRRYARNCTRPLMKVRLQVNTTYNKTKLNVFQNLEAEYREIQAHIIII